MTEACTGGMVEYCQRLNIKPDVLFSLERSTQIRIVQGILYILSSREGYTNKELEMIYGKNGTVIGRCRNFAQRQIVGRRNPKAIEIWNKVKDLTFKRVENYRKEYIKDGQDS